MANGFQLLLVNPGALCWMKCEEKKNNKELIILKLDLRIGDVMTQYVIKLFIWMK